jgi:hypothetical protein
VARVHSKESRVLVNDTSASCDLTGYTATHSRNMSPITTLCDEGARFLPGLMSGSVGLRGVFDSSANSFYQESQACVGVDDGYLVTIAPAGLTVGSPAFLAVSDLSEFTVDSSVADAVSTTVGATPDNGVDWGVMLHALSAETADDDAASVDNAAASSGGGVANLHVTAYSGLTSISIKIESSPDDAIWSDFITFTSVTAVTSERKTVSGSVPRYLRAWWDVTGTGSCTFAVAFARR